MKGFEGYMGVLAMMRGAMPDIKWKIEETISEGDKILVRYTMFLSQRYYRHPDQPLAFSAHCSRFYTPCPIQVLK